MLLSGCQKEDSAIEQLRKENPFKKTQQQEVKESRHRISCTSLKLVVPETIDVSDLAIFKNYSLTSSPLNRKGPANILNQNQIQTWLNNGFLIALAPKSLQDQTVEAVKRFFADERPTTRLNIYNGSSEFSDITLAVVNEQRTISFADTMKNTKLYQVSSGEFLFRFHATISSPQQINTKTVNFFLIPVFRESMPRGPLLASNGQGSLPVTGCKELIFSGTFSNDQTLAITCSPAAIAEKLPAAEMLYNRQTQCRTIILLSPEAVIMQ